MKRLVLVALSLVGLVGCLDVEQDLTVVPNGEIAYRLTLSMLSDIAHGKFAKKPEDLAKDWAALIPESAAAYTTSTITEHDDRVWLVMDVHVPSAAAWDDFRGAFIGNYEAKNKPQSIIYPPQLTSKWGSVQVRQEILPAETPAETPPTAAAPLHWRFRLHPEGANVSSNADHVEADGTLVWESPLVTVMNDGRVVEASLSGGLSWATWAAIAAAGFAILGGIALVVGLTRNETQAKA